MSKFLRKDKDPIPMMKNFEAIDGTIITPYGFSVKSDNKYGYSYEYSSKLEFSDPNNSKSSGFITSSDLAYALEILAKDPNKFREKPKSIIQLENKYSVTANRKKNYLGGWHIYTDRYSLFNNPLNLSIGYTENENTFEIWIFSENEPRDYVSLESIIEILDNLNN